MEKDLALDKEQEKIAKLEDIEPKKSLLSITWPIFIDLTLHYSTLLINIFMVGAVSVAAVAELTVGNQVFELCLIIFNFINIGVSVVCAQALGANNKKLIKRLLHMGIGINLISGLLVSLFIFFGSSFIVYIMQVPDDILESSDNYLKILALALLFEAFCLFCTAVLRAYECTRDAMFVSVIVNITTILGNAMFLFGFLGAPVIGVEGVAISTVIGRVLGSMIFIPLILKRTKIKIYPRFLFVFKKRILSAILNVGLPGAGENLAWHLQYMTMVAVVATLGTTAMATQGIYFQVMMMMMLFAFSIATGTEILVAHYAGALKLDLAYKQLIRSVQIGLVATILITFSMPLGTGNFIISKFTDDPAVLLMASQLFLLTVFMEPGRILNIIIINSLRAVGDTKFPLICAVISMWGISVPLGSYLALYTDLGILGVWIGFCADEWVRGISMYIRWRSCKWKKKAIDNYNKHLSKPNSEIASL